MIGRRKAEDFLPQICSKKGRENPEHYSEGIEHGIRQDMRLGKLPRKRAGNLSARFGGKSSSNSPRIFSRSVTGNSPQGSIRNSLRKSASNFQREFARTCGTDDSGLRAPTFERLEVVPSRKKFKNTGAIFGREISTISVEIREGGEAALGRGQALPGGDPRPLSPEIPPCVGFG